MRSVDYGSPGILPGSIDRSLRLPVVVGNINWRCALFGGTLTTPLAVEPGGGRNHLTEVAYANNDW